MAITSVFSNKMIISDFDGTLRGNDGQIPQRNIDAIKRFTSLGGTFIVASGRAGFVLDAVEPLVSQIVNGPCIYSNGSYFYDYTTNERSEEKYISEKIVRDILYTSKELDNEAGIRIVRGNDYLTPEVNDEIKRQIDHGYMNNVKVYTFDTTPTDRINKITVCSNASIVLKVKEEIEKKYSSFVDVLLSAKTLIDIQPKNVSKGSAVELLRQRYKEAGNSKIIYGVGDYGNDLDLLKASDKACCPSNALEAVKEYCSIHLCSNVDGCIADLIEKIENNLA